MRNLSANLIACKKTARFVNGALSLSLLLLVTGCASTPPSPVVVTKTVMIYPNPLPIRLTSKITAPQLPDRQLTNNDLLQLIARYHSLLERANNDRTETKQRWPDDND